MKRLFLIVALFLSLPSWAGRSFNGTTDVITIAGNGNAIDIVGQKISVAQWIYLASLPVGEQDTLGKCQAAGQCQYLMVINASGHANQAGFYLRVSIPINHDQFTFCTTTLTAPAWHHLAATVDISGAGNNGQFYLDGTPCGTMAINNTGTVTTTGSNLLIGGSANSFFAGTATHFSGKIAETAIWNVRLSAGEVKGLAQGVPSNQVRSTTLAGYWPLWGSPSAEPDLSGNKLSGTLTGTGIVNHCPCMPLK